MRREAGWGRLERLWRFWRLPPPASTNLHNLQNLLLVLLLACQARGSARGVAREFDGGRAFSYVEQQMQFGPRIPNTPAHERTGDWILAQLRPRADTVGVQAITHVTRRGDTLHLRNFLARFRPAAAERVLFLAHWDTRPHADQSANLGQQRLPVPGANDGASGVAVLLGVADALKAKPPAVGVDLLFVDGEDYGDFTKDSTDVLIGWRWCAENAERGSRNAEQNGERPGDRGRRSVPRSAFRLRRFSGAPRIERVPLAGGRTVTVPPWTTATPRCCSPASRWPAPACAMRSLQHPPPRQATCGSPRPTHRRPAGCARRRAPRRDWHARCSPASESTSIAPT